MAWRLLETGTAVNLEAFCVLWLVELYNFMSLGLVWRGLAILDYVHARSLPRGQRGSRWRSAAGSSTGSSAWYRRSFADASDDSTSCTHGSVCEGAVSRSTQPSHRRRSGRPRRAPSASATNASPCPKAQCPARGPGGVCRPACVRLTSLLPSFVICGRSPPPRVGDPNGAVGIPETSSRLLPTQAPSLRATALAVVGTHLLGPTVRPLKWPVLRRSLQWWVAISGLLIGPTGRKRPGEGCR